MLNPLKKNNVTVLEEGDYRDTIIFAHGFGTDQTAWSNVYPAFAKDYRIVLYDNVGAGKSDPGSFSPNKYDTLQTYANDLLDICNGLSIDNAIIVAHSVSGMISVLASLKEPHRFKKMVLVGASARYLNDEEKGYVGGFDQESLNGLYQAMATNYFAWVSGFAPAAMANADNPKLAESFAQSLSAIRPDIAQSVAKVIFQSDNREKLKECKANVLLLQTKQDIAVTQQAAEYLHEQLENSTLEIVDAEGHFPHISVPDQIVTAIKNFI